MEVVTIFEFLAHCGDVDDFFLSFGEVRSTENTIEGDHGKSFASAACKPRQPPYLHPGSTSAARWFLEEDDGDAESAKSEMMVASSVLL